ncbi:MAG: carboxypeptidase regulatory-like domain-containing protein [Gemmatirosa sp.]|nr:carboxypeptidase regulatory-like domain-containing protein [Gemmatirosa sp.]
MRQQYSWLVVAVASADGTPIRNAEIEVGPARNGARRPLDPTDASGRAAACNLTPGDYQVRAADVAGEWAEAWRVVHLEAGRNAVSLTLAAARRPLAGGAS